jgi:hypothetical protein
MRMKGRGLALVVVAIGVSACGTSKAEEAAKTAQASFKQGQVCVASKLVPSNSTYTAACEERERKEKAERERAERREAVERKAKEKKEAAEQKLREKREAAERRAEEARKRREDAEAHAREERQKQQEEKAKYEAEHKGELNDHRRWSEEVRHNFVSSCEAAAAEGEKNRETCECVTDNVEAVESEEQLEELEAGSVVDGKEILERLALKAKEGC